MQRVRSVLDESVYKENGLCLNFIPTGLIVTRASGSSAGALAALCLLLDLPIGNLNCEK